MKRILALLTALIIVINCSAQKPTIMVVPSDAWCKRNGFATEITIAGDTKLVCNYKKAFQESFDLKAVISKINEIFGKRGYPLHYLEDELKKVDNDAMRQTATNIDRQLKNKAGIAETMREKIEKIAKTDITIDIDWDVKTNGPEKAIFFILNGSDSYVHEEVANASGQGQFSMSSTLTLLLQEAVLQHINNFTSSLDSYFKDLVSEGRKITVEIERYDDGGTWDKNFESEYNGDELKLLIKNWMSDNCKKGIFETIESSENRIVYSPVRIALMDDNGRKMDAESFGYKLQKFLKSAPFNIPTKVEFIGLGKVHLICGPK